MSGSEELLGAVLPVLIAAAVAVFWRIQLYLADPHRQELNEAWFKQFEQFLRSRYRDRELRWRIHVLETQLRNR